MRFTRRNWIKYFDGHNKQTTIRLKKSRIGHHKAYAGSYYHPEILGDFNITKICGIKYKDLTEQNAKDDGFDTLKELQEELQILNGKIEPETILYQHWTDNISFSQGDNQKVETCESGTAPQCSPKYDVGNKA